MKTIQIEILKLIDQRLYFIIQNNNMIHYKIEIVDFLEEFTY
jgi:hypothetical protein